MRESFEENGSVPSDGELRGSCGGGAGLSEFCDYYMGKSPAFLSVLETVNLISLRNCSVLITGETGVGKELVARQIHYNSKRRQKVFVPVDCSTLTGQLFESQLFGHTKGAFTGAVRDSLGFFRAADGGTLFLDEIGEIPIELQAKLLRVLQDGVVTPVGSTKSHKVDVRVLCATNRNLQEMLKDETFRADLYYRLNVITVEVPPLRNRKEDTIGLAEFFLDNHAAFYGEPQKFLCDDSKSLLLNYSWPGNVRELANAMERAYVLTLDSQIKSLALPFEILVSDIETPAEHTIPSLNQAQRKVIITALDYTNGKKIAAANLLGVERRKLNRLIEKLNITV